jgi:hypothetical protein
MKNNAGQMQESSGQTSVISFMSNVETLFVALFRLSLASNSNGTSKISAILNKNIKYCFPFFVSWLVLQFQHQLFFSPSYKIKRNFFLVWFIRRIYVELLNCVFMCSKAL